MPISRPYGGFSFNPRTREGCDIAPAIKIPPARVSIHAPARGATLASTRRPIRSVFQSTHPRGVRLDDLSAYAYGLYVSIHAPARGATRQRYGQRSTNRVSIHAPARGATEEAHAAAVPWEFQSTHPRGVRRSISSYRRLIISFNPRTREGCDPLIAFMRQTQ